MKLLAAGVLCWRLGRSPCGERGLKYPRLALDILQRRRSPCGERGLKLLAALAAAGGSGGAPRAGSVD